MNGTVFVIYTGKTVRIMDTLLKKKHPVIRYKYYLAGGIIFLGFLIYVIVAGGGPRRLNYDTEKLEIATVRHEKFLEYLDVEGVVQPKLTIKLNALEVGTVEQIVADEGSMLKRGDTILTLANPELLRTIEDEHDELEKQRVSYEEKQLEMQRKSSALQRQMMEAVYNFNRLAKQYTLDHEEFKMGVKSKAQLEIAVEEYQFKQKETKLLLDELTHDSLSNVIQATLMRNDLRREEKRFARSSERRSNLIVRAPVAGQLSFIGVTNGEHVSAGSSIGELKVIDRFKIKTKVSEYYIDRIMLGLPASVMYQGKKYPLKIAKVNPEIRERQFEVDLVFTDEQPDNIRLGKNYRLQIELGQPEDVLVMGKGNFFTFTGGQWVFKLNAAGGRAVKTPIAIGRQNPLQYEILGGLKAGDRVIVTGYDNFGDAQEIVLK
jgi:multidrug efflux pump subunit AcrA (membrane-fusion protein)